MIIMNNQSVVLYGHHHIIQSLVWAYIYVRFAILKFIEKFGFWFS